MEVTGNFSTENFAYSKEMTTISKKGFEILRNIENCRLLQRDTPKRQDYVTKYSINKLDTNGKSINGMQQVKRRKTLPTFQGKL